MKRLHAAVLCSLLSIAIFSGCKKDDKPSAKECQVQQFDSNTDLFYNGVFGPIPYLFSKTFDLNGKVNTIDAFVYPLGEATRQQAKLEYRNQMVYLLDQNSSDTIMIVWLNNAGRVIKAQEKSGFRYKNTSPVMSYEFMYNSENKLYQYTAENRSNPTYPSKFTLPVEYDGNGNCTRASNSYFTYDLTRTAKKQFYFDSESLGNYWLGFKLLEYLNYFPEITSPANIRTNTKVMEGTYVIMNTALSNHQIDVDGKLISYKAGNDTIPIFWNCGQTNPKNY